MIMKAMIRHIKAMMPGPAAVLLAVLIPTLLLLNSIAIGQVTSHERYIYLSGQLTNTETGAPIPDHDIYISADSAANSGFTYYAVTKTDANGFYLDTIVTTVSDGILRIHLFDFSGNPLELDRYYRFVWENTYMMFANFSIIDPNSNTEFQANFTTMGDPLEENPMKVLFRDVSIGSSIKAWDWEFGDGRTSELQDPEHVYEEPGNYLVTLTVSSLPPEFEQYITSTITKQVQVGMTEFHHVGGHVIANYFPIDFGLAYLYAFDAEDNLVPVDTAVIDTLGYYYFYQLPAGKYLTKARLAASSVLYGQFMPTYFGNVFEWDEATPIILNEDNWRCDIWLMLSDGLIAGQGEILGQISYDTTHSAGSLIPAGDIEILLLSGQGASLTCNISNIDGYFTFSGLEYGTYQLYPDVAGISTAPMFVTISEDMPLADNLSLVILPEQITFAIHEPESDYLENAVLLYPNPVKEQARISLQMKQASAIRLVITDLSGRTVMSRELRLGPGPEDVLLDASSLPAGCYQVVIIPEDRRIISGKFLKHN